jgi:NAD(P)H-dependent FMN reductase
MTDKIAIQVLAICGSLRAASFNRMAMQAAMAAVPQGMNISEGLIADLPTTTRIFVREATPPPWHG